MRPFRTSVVVLLVSLPVVSLAAQQPAPSRLRLEQSLEIETISDPEISPDGRRVVYTRGWVNRQTDTRESSLWILNADGTQERALTEGSGAEWSPDGTRIAYLAQGRPSGTQLWVRYMDAEGAATQITRVEETPENLAWSPDGKYLAFTMLVPEKESWTPRLPGKPDSARWTQNPRVIDRLVYRRDRRGFLEDGFTHIFVVSAAGGTPRQVTSGNFDHGAPQWTPDGRSIVFSGLREPEAEYLWRESEIYSVDVATGAVRQLTRRKGPDTAPVVSPDGRHVAYLGYDFTDDTYRDNELYVMNADGSNVRLLTGSFERAPESVRWAPDGREIYFNVPSEGSYNVYAATLDGRVRPVTRGVHDLRANGISRNGTLVGVRSDPHNPGDVVRFTARDPEPRQLTRVNEDVLANVELGKVEEIWYTMPDGFRVQGWIVRPPQFDSTRKYPLQLHIHGGPHSMYGVGFNLAFQEHAANDYVVLYTNPRGSTGYGSAFGNAIKNAYPGKDYDDLMAGVDLVLSRGYVDANNLFVTGCSGGGVLTAWIVGHTDRFRAASANCPVVNWFSFVGTTDGANWYRNFARLPWEDPSEHLRRSPLMYVGNVKTPTMLMTGVNDLRTPMAQTEEFYQALKLRKVPTVMVRLNDEWHGTSSKPSNFMRTQLYLREWFERWMTPEGLQKRNRRAE
ncbi:MAG TPA: S9 family peptidase [Longimicrobiaceae bacterium]|nr:S9 family peptidase [Longimicrobiaceae bacterium]